MEIQDSYDHVNSKIYYISESILFTSTKNDPDAEEINLLYNSCVENCSCENTCLPFSCSCISKFETNVKSNNSLIKPYILNEIYKELVLSNELKVPIYECNSLCSCTNSCSNRLVQRGPRNFLTIKDCFRNVDGPFSDVGLFTEMDIPKGGFICEYAGEILTRQEAINRHNINEVNNSKNYIMCFNEHIGKKKIQTFIDPSIFGNIGRYINHSCEPNSNVIPVRINSVIPKLCIFAMENINKGSQITFSYGKISGNMKNIDGFSYKQCFCDSRNCLKRLPFMDYDFDG